jgi:hypothetical protein
VHTFSHNEMRTDRSDEDADGFLRVAIYEVVSNGVFDQNLSDRHFSNIPSTVSREECQKITTNSFSQQFHEFKLPGKDKNSF